MAVLRCCRWFARVCCCCCSCCCMCEEPPSNKPLLSAETPESSPAPGKEAGISELCVRSEGGGGEVQEMKVDVSDEPAPRSSSPPQDNTDRQAQSSPTAVTMRSHTGNIVRGSSARLSWRMIPSVAAPEAVEQKPEPPSPARREGAVMRQTEEGSISFIDGETGRKAPYRNVVLVTQEVEGENEPTAEVTSSFTISSQGITVP